MVTDLEHCDNISLLSVIHVFLLYDCDFVSPVLIMYFFVLLIFLCQINYFCHYVIYDVGDNHSSVFLFF